MASSALMEDKTSTIIHCGIHDFDKGEIYICAPYQEGFPFAFVRKRYAFKPDNPDLYKNLTRQFLPVKKDIYRVLRKGKEA